MAQQSLASPSTTPNQGAYPMVRAMGLQALLERDAEKPPPSQDITDEGALSALAGHVRAAWGRNKLAKQRIDLKLLSCLRARRGVYSPAELATLQANSSGMNFVYADLTETKCRAASAWIREIVLPTGEQPWGIDPTPMPELPLDLQKSIVMQAVTQAQAVMKQIMEANQAAAAAAASPQPTQPSQGPQDPSQALQAPPGAPPGQSADAGPPQQTAPMMTHGPLKAEPPLTKQEFRDMVRKIGDGLRDEAEQQLKKVAERRAKRMELQLSDRLAEGGYEAAMDAFVEDFVTYPAAILKGPTYRRHKTLKWAAGFTPEVADNPAQTWDRCSPFDVYPAPSARDCQTGDFIERIRYERSELYDLKGLPGYRDDQIDMALRDYTAGHLEGWLWTEAERQKLEQESMYMWLAPPGIIDALNYWGSVPGWKLMTWGVTSKNGEDIEPTKDYECNVLLCGRYVLYAALNPDPLDKRPYRKACYDEIPGAFWGRSIPDLAATSQKMCNGIACALADNLSMASGPMVWVHADRFADGEDTQAIYPWRLWQLKSDPTQGVNPGIGFFQANDNSASLMATYEKWEIRADDATGIPRYTYGNERAGGSADTATGLSMLMNNAAKGLRRAISSIDMHVTSLTIGDAFTNEMLYNPDMTIKGDCIVVPRGAAAILIKESAQQRRTQFLGMVTQSPVLTQIIGPKYIANIVREVATAMELPPDSVPTEEEVDAQVQQQQQSAAAQGQMAMQMEQAKEAAIGQREAQQQNAKIVGEIVTQAVTAALAGHPFSAQQEAGAAQAGQAAGAAASAGTEGGGAETAAAPKGSKKIKHSYDKHGNLTSSEVVTADH